MIHLVGVGEVHGTRRRTEALIDLPVFPLAVATTGPVTLDKVQVASVKDEVLDQSLADILASELGPGNLASNSRHSPASITLRQNTRVTGFVQSCGSVDVQSSTIGGELRQNWPEAAEMPDMQASYLDPRQGDPDREILFANNLPGVNPASPDGRYPQVTVNGPMRTDGSLYISGPLNLNDGILYVDGDLTVEGGILGQGAVGVRGTTHIYGRTRLRATSRVAVVSDGDLTISGQDKNAEVFEGILYGRGRITTEKVTLLGACVQNAPPGSPGATDGVVLRDSNLVYATAPAAASFDPPIDTLMATANPSQGGGADLAFAKVSPHSRDNDAIVGRTSVRRSRTGTQAGPAELVPNTNGANDWGPSDVMLLRTAFDANGNPRFALLGWGRSGDTGLPLTNPDGSPLFTAFFYPSSQSLLSEEPGSGTQGLMDAIYWIFANDPTHVGTQFNFPKILRYGVGGSGGYQEFGNGGAEDTSEGTMRANLTRTVTQIVQMREALRQRIPRGAHHFTMDPSRFLSRVRAVKVHAWREF